MSVKNNKTNTKIVIHYTESKRDAERKFQVKYSARTILLILLGRSFAYVLRVSGLGIGNLDRPPQDVAVLVFQILWARTRGSMFQDSDVLRSPDFMQLFKDFTLVFTVAIVGLYYFIFLMKPRYLNKIE